MKGHMQDGKFHPHTDYKKGTRKSRDQKEKSNGVKVKPRKQRTVLASQLEGMTRAKREEWEHVVGSQVVKVKKEMMNGRPVTSVRFANGEEWFEFDDIKHQEEYLKEENIEVDDEITGEFVEIDHPDIAGYVTMPTGKVLFGEREDSRRKRDVSQQISFYEDPSHGFYKVPNSLLKELGIQDEITNSSKRQADFTFLEEDQDATTFFNALKEKGIESNVDNIKQNYFDSPNENPASLDFRLCDKCGETFNSIESLKRHKARGHSGS